MLERGKPVPVRCQGPIGLNDVEKPWLRYPVLVCVTGGIGVRHSRKSQTLRYLAIDSFHETSVQRQLIIMRGPCRCWQHCTCCGG